MMTTRSSAMLSWSFLFLLGLATAVMAIPEVRVTLTPGSDDGPLDPLLIMFKIENLNAEEPLFVIKERLPLPLSSADPKLLLTQPLPLPHDEGPVRPGQDLFSVTKGDGSEATFLGIQVDCLPFVFPRDYLFVPPSGSLKYLFYLGRDYAFSAPGAYQVSYNVFHAGLACDSTGESCINEIPSTTLDLKVDGGLERQSRHLRMQKQQLDEHRRLADAFGNCTDDHKAKIEKAKKDALECACDSLDCVKDLKPENDNTYFEMFFGDDTQVNINEVKSDFAAIKDDLEVDMTFICNGAFCTEPNYIAYVYPGLSGQKAVFFCPLFYELPAEGKTSRMGTMVHEASHYADGANTDDLGYGLEIAKDLAKNNQTAARNNADNFRFFCECLPNGGGGWGDPHFKTWRGTQFDFHGEADLVLLRSPSFASGQGLELHIRTALDTNRRYSYISGAALKIGNDVLEVAGHGEFYFNGMARDASSWTTTASAEPSRLSGFPVAFQETEKKRHIFHIDLGHGQNIAIVEYKEFLSVSIPKGDKAQFFDSVGLMGSFATGSKLARDGKSIIKDANDFGIEWQVRDTELKLFHTDRAPQYPELPIMPTLFSTTSTHRRLEEVTSVAVSRGEAEIACAAWGDEKEACIFDVLVTDDLEMADMVEQVDAGAFKKE